jgi:hypothetical protein
MDRYYASRTMLSPGPQHSGWIAVVGSPESKERIGMAMQCGPAPGTAAPLKVRYKLTIGDRELDGEWILDGGEFRPAE